MPLFFSALPLPRSAPLLSAPPKKPRKLRASSMEAGANSPVREFPHLLRPHRELVAGLLSAVDSRLGPHLLPSTVPPDVLSFHNAAGTSHGALDIRSGAHDSSVDFILESWIHCKVPTGALNITTLFAFLNASTDAPHLLMELIQSSPTSLILFMDLLPRKDLVLHPDYCNEFYQETNLDKQRQDLEKVPQAKLFRPSSLYIRSILSPTAVAFHINCEEDGQSALEEIMSGPMDSVAKEMVRIWLDKCACSSKQLEGIERDWLIRRDNLMKNKTVEIDLAASLPRLFGPDVASRVVGAIQKAYRI